MEIKHCSGCVRDLPLSCFSKNPSKRDGFNTRCKECHAAYQAGWYQQNKVKHGQRTRERNKNLSKKHREFILQYLLKHPCVDCGEKDPVVLEFDHVRGLKKDNVSLLVRSGFSWEVVQKEIDKCEVRCANCHRRVTAKRQGRVTQW